MRFTFEFSLLALSSLIGVLNASDNFSNLKDYGDAPPPPPPPPPPVEYSNSQVNQLSPKYNGPSDRDDDNDNSRDGNSNNNRYDNSRSGNSYNNRYDNSRDGNPYNNNRDGNPYNNGVPPPPPPQVVAAQRFRYRHCQPEKFEHPVIMKKYSDSTGYWVLYTQILETRNVANRCHRNEYVYLAHRQKAGWFWNPKITSLVQYSLGEPKFVSRVVKHPERAHLSVVVNMSRNYANSSADLDRIFPKRLAREITRLGSDDTKWSETARTALPILQMDNAYFQTITPKENTGSQHLKVLHDDRVNMEILE